MSSSTMPIHSTMQQPVQYTAAMSTGSILTQVSAALAVVLLVIIACGWLAKRSGLAQRKTTNNTLNISASCRLGQRERIVVVDVEDARLVLGVTPQQITHIHTLPPRTPEENSTPTALRADFRQALQTLLQHTGKPQ